MRFLAILVFWLGNLHAADSPTGIWFPTTTIPSARGNGDSFPGTANKLRCLDFVPVMGITNATKISYITVGTWNATVGFALYALGGTSQLMSTSTAVAAPATTMVTGITPFSLSAGSIYRGCWCASTNSASYQGADTVGGVATAGSVIPILNSFSIHGPLATNTCTAGVPPLTTGALVDEANLVNALGVWISKE